MWMNSAKRTLWQLDSTSLEVEKINQETALFPSTTERKYLCRSIYGWFLNSKNLGGDGSYSSPNSLPFQSCYKASFPLFFPFTHHCFSIPTPHLSFTFLLFSLLQQLFSKQAADPIQSKTVEDSQTSRGNNFWWKPFICFCRQMGSWTHRCINFLTFTTLAWKKNIRWVCWKISIWIISEREIWKFSEKFLLHVMDFIWVSIIWISSLHACIYRSLNEHHRNMKNFWWWPLCCWSF